MYAGCSQFRCSIVPTITKRCLTLVFASIVVGSGIENSKVVFEIAPCKLGIAFSYIHKRAKNTAGRATSGTRVLYNFQRCIYKKKLCTLRSNSAYTVAILVGVNSLPYDMTFFFAHQFRELVVAIFRYSLFSEFPVITLTIGWQACETSS